MESFFLSVSDFYNSVSFYVNYIIDFVNKTIQNLNFLSLEPFLNLNPFYLTLLSTSITFIVFNFVRNRKAD